MYEWPVDEGGEILKFVYPFEYIEAQYLRDRACDHNTLFAETYDDEDPAIRSDLNTYGLRFEHWYKQAESDKKEKKPYPFQDKKKKADPLGFFGNDITMPWG